MIEFKELKREDAIKHATKMLKADPKFQKSPNDKIQQQILSRMENYINKSTNLSLNMREIHSRAEQMMPDYEDRKSVEFDIHKKLEEHKTLLISTKKHHPYAEKNIDMVNTDGFKKSIEEKIWSADGIMMSDKVSDETQRQLKANLDKINKLRTEIRELRCLQIDPSPKELQHYKEGISSERINNIIKGYDGTTIKIPKEIEDHCKAITNYVEISSTLINKIINNHHEKDESFNTCVKLINEGLEVKYDAIIPKINDNDFTQVSNDLQKLKDDVCEIRNMFQANDEQNITTKVTNAYSKIVQIIRESIPSALSNMHNKQSVQEYDEAELMRLIDDHASDKSYYDQLKYDTYKEYIPDVKKIINATLEKRYEELQKTFSNDGGTNLLTEHMKSNIMQRILSFKLISISSLDETVNSTVYHFDKYFIEHTINKQASLEQTMKEDIKLDLCGKIDSQYDKFAKLDQKRKDKGNMFSFIEPKELKKMFEHRPSL